MDRSSRRRICKVEKLLSAATRESEEKAKTLRMHARSHAPVVAAIVLAGEPKIDEPLSEALRRALQHYGILASLQDVMTARANRSFVEQVVDQMEATEQLAPVILGGAKVSARFTEIFRTAPSWLLNFTHTSLDADILKFKLPEKLGRSKWGSKGYENSRAWPLIPLGRITDGDPISGDDVRFPWL